MRLEATLGAEATLSKPQRPRSRTFGWRCSSPSIDAYIDTRNARSIALAERLGFARLALLPENDVIDGKLADDYHYRLDLTKDPLWHA